MGIIRERIEHEYHDAIILVVERESDEVSSPWKIIEIEINQYDRLSPSELRKIGRWLVEQSKRIGREYRSNGKPKQD